MAGHKDYMGRSPQNLYSYEQHVRLSSVPSLWLTRTEIHYWDIVLYMHCGRFLYLTLDTQSILPAADSDLCSPLRLAPELRSSWASSSVVKFISDLQLHRGTEIWRKLQLSGETYTHPGLCSCWHQAVMSLMTRGPLPSCFAQTSACRPTQRIDRIILNWSWGEF